jgi:hypothetical protein
MGATSFSAGAGTSISQANQAALEAETNEDTYAPPDLIKHSPGVAKAWCRVTTAGAIVSGDYNIASVTDTGTGTRSLVIDTDFADLYYVPTATISNDSGASYAGTVNFNTYAVGSVTALIRQWSGGTETTLDLPHGQAIFGDQ